ncbi:MAG TPA: glycoside hydrolase family 15 protein [Stellaceae bacterium]|nr:glycoside hydrolase family 15 protein [Stellaceae bacterium]
MRVGLSDRPWDIAIETRLVAHLEKVWEQPDRGICEMRGPPRHFTHSKVMAWVAIDRYLRLKSNPRTTAPPTRRFAPTDAPRDLR